MQAHCLMGGGLSSGRSYVPLASPCHKESSGAEFRDHYDGTRKLSFKGAVWALDRLDRALDLGELPTSYGKTLHRLM